MGKFYEFSIRTKLMVMMMGIMVVALCLTFYVATNHGKAALHVAADKRLEAVLKARQGEVSRWFLDSESEAISQGQNPFVVAGFRAFRKGWTRIGADMDDAARAEALRQVYPSERANPEAPRAMPRIDPVYGAAHDRYHAYFARLLVRAGFQDAFLIDPDGTVIYSATKGPEFAANVTEGALAETGLAGVFLDALEQKGQNPVHSEFESYAPDGGALASFTARPLINAQGNVVGVIAFRERISLLEDILFERSNLGETGYAVLVDSDRQALFGGGTEQSDWNIAPVRRALGGLSGKTELDLDVGPTVIHFAPVSFLGRSWALLVVQESADIAAPARAMTQAIMREGVIILVFAALVAFSMARSISHPLKRLAETMTAIRTGKTHRPIPETRRRDEIGTMARALSDFRDAMVLNDELARETSFKGSAFEGASAAQTLIDLDMRITYANGAFAKLMSSKLSSVQERIADLDPQDSVGRSIDEFQDDPERIRGILRNKACLPYRVEVSIGGVDFVLIFSAAVDQSGTMIGYVVEWIDVTEERMREAMLEAINTRQVMAEFDMDGQLVTANPAFLALVERSFEEVKGRALDEFLEPSEQAEEADAEDEAEFDLPGQSRFVTIGTGRILEGGMTTVVDRSGVPTRLLLMGQDITRDHQKLAAAEAAKSELMEEQSTVVAALTSALSELSQGNLTTQIDTEFPALYEQLRADFNHALETLRIAIRTVSTNAASVQSEASDITSAADDLSRRTEHQAATLEETAAALDLLTTNLKRAATEADQADGVVNTAREHADKSGEVVEKAVQAMGQIADSSHQISHIISVIDDIAFQTNLLALNAGVEAARAGDAGRGFAVVASEVRALAQRSADAAREIGSLISKSTRHVDQGVGLVGEAGQALQLIVDTIGDVSKHVSQIAQSAGEQSQSIAEINSAVTNLDRVTQQNAAMFEETTAASHALTREAAQMSEAMAQFALDAPGEDSVAIALVPEPECDVDAPGEETEAPTELPLKVLQVANGPDSPVETTVETGADEAGHDGWEEF
ncbi:MAG: methyl-accepting chemotaxis protein [Pseudomonadota bacterium]